MDKKIVFILDIDGVMTDGTFLYDETGKRYKKFGPDDADALKLIKKNIEIVFCSADFRGFNISEKRINDMGYNLNLVNTNERLKWINDNYPSSDYYRIYMGDSFVDVYIMNGVDYAITTNDANNLAKAKANYITKYNGGNRAVSDAVFHIASKFLDKSFSDLCGIENFMENSYNSYKNVVLNEISQVLSSINPKSINEFIDMIINSDKICGYGAGRMGYGLRAFMMRLNHLGIPGYFINDTFIPPMNKYDLFIVTSGSGNTQSVLEYLKIAKEKAGCKTVAITGDPNSPMAKMADFTIIFKSSNGGMNSKDNKDKINSIQPMTSLNEQSMFVLFDIISVMLIKKLNIKKEDEKKFHFNIE